MILGAAGLLLLAALMLWYVLLRHPSAGTPIETQSAAAEDVVADAFGVRQVSPASTTPVSIAAPDAAPDTPPSGMKEYRNTNFHFSLFYADDLTVSGHPVAGGALVVLFQDQAAGRGFQIFVTPYAQPKITPERFAMDEPSGVLNDPVNIVIDGAPATEFFSTNEAMGASREIWFVYGGFLYEVTTPQQLDSWLSQFTGTWRFI